MLTAHLRVRPGDLGDERFHRFAQFWPFGYRGGKRTARAANFQRIICARDFDVAPECDHRRGRRPHAIVEWPDSPATDLEG